MRTAGMVVESSISSLFLFFFFSLKGKEKCKRCLTLGGEKLCGSILYLFVRSIPQVSFFPLFLIFFSFLSLFSNFLSFFFQHSLSLSFSLSFSLVPPSLSLPSMLCIPIYFLLRFHNRCLSVFFILSSIHSLPFFSIKPLLSFLSILIFSPLFPLFFSLFIFFSIISFFIVRYIFPSFFLKIIFSCFLLFYLTSSSSEPLLVRTILIRCYTKVRLPNYLGNSSCVVVSKQW